MASFLFGWLREREECGDIPEQQLSNASYMPKRLCRIWTNAMVESISLSLQSKTGVSTFVDISFNKVVMLRSPTASSARPWSH
jgi:hypothetical protein